MVDLSKVMVEGLSVADVIKYQQIYINAIKDISKDQEFEETELIDKIDKLRKLRYKGFGIYTKEGVQHKAYQVIFMHRTDKTPNPVAVMRMEEEHLHELQSLLPNGSMVFSNYYTVYIYLN